MDNVPDDIWFADVVISYRLQGSSNVNVVVMPFGVRVESRIKALGQAEGICDRVIQEITTDHPDAAILSTRASVSSGSGENGVVDDIANFDFVK